uniref:BCL6 corepressor n=1 Tax=Tetraodon nigroviridis TaxID=99883 RepID=H3C3E3_TETNG
TKPNPELRQGNHVTQNMVDARLTPLAAMGLDRSALMHNSLRLHSGVVYPGIRALSGEKSRENPSIPLAYNRDGLPELIYKPDASLESQKATNGYLGLYKGTPPSLHKPMLVPGAEGLGLERRVGPGEKASEMGLTSAGGSYLRLPWLNPYPEASMYPFIDTTKYAALNMYKASLLSQPSPYLPQHLAYPSLCAAQGGSVNPAAAASAAERLYYMPPYPAPPISSPLVAPPMRIPTVTVAPTSLVHCQDKGLSVAPPFPQQLHQPSPHTQHLQKSASSNSNTASNSANGTTGAIGSLSTDGSRLSQPPPPPALIDNSLDLQRPVARLGQPPTSSTASISASSSATQSIPHPFFVSSMASEQSSPARPSPHKHRTRDGAPEQRSVGDERRSSRSPSKPSFERSVHQPQPTKDSAEKPLDLSGRILEFGLPTNGFPVKMESIAQGARYGLPPSRELLKENPSLSPSSNPHSVVPERPEMISTLHSSWVVPSQAPSSAKGSPPSVIKHKSLERVHPQQRSSSCPRIGEPPHNGSSTHSSLSSSRALSPKTTNDWVRHSPSRMEQTTVKGHHREGTEKSTHTIKRAETTSEGPSFKRPCLENGHPPGHLYLPQNDTYLNHSLAYANRYLHYPVADGMTLHSMPITGKGPVYPHPGLLGSSSLYPTHLTAKHPLSYHNLPAGSGGEYLTYNSQEMAHPLMHAPPDKMPDRGDVGLKTRGQERSRGVIEDCGGQRDLNMGKDLGEATQFKLDKQMGTYAQSGSQCKGASSVPSREKIVCIDLVHSDTDMESTPAGSKQLSAETGGKVNQKECTNQNLTEPKHHLSHPYSAHQGQSPTVKPNHPDRPTDAPTGKARSLPASSSEAGSAGLTSTLSPTSPGLSAQVEEIPEEPICSPEPEDPDQSTLRCARTSGERSSEDGSQSSSKNCRRSSLAKRIANSSGFVGDRFKCVTTELYADSSKLGREQRALQMEVISREASNISQPATNWERAMMRFSELELKEKEGGGVCVTASAAAAAGRELADTQHGEQALEHSQYSSRQGETEALQMNAWKGAHANNRGAHTLAYRSGSVPFGAVSASRGPFQPAAAVSSELVQHSSRVQSAVLERSRLVSDRSACGEGKTEEGGENLRLHKQGADRCANNFAFRKLVSHCLDAFREPHQYKPVDAQSACLALVFQRRELWAYRTRAEIRAPARQRQTCRRGSHAVLQAVPPHTRAQGSILEREIRGRRERGVCESKKARVWREAGLWWHAQSQRGAAYHNTLPVSLPNTCSHSRSQADTPFLPSSSPPSIHSAQKRERGWKSEINTWTGEPAGISIEIHTPSKGHPTGSRTRPTGSGPVLQRFTRPLTVSALLTAADSPPVWWKQTSLTAGRPTVAVQDQRRGFRLRRECFSASVKSPCSVSILPCSELSRRNWLPQRHPGLGITHALTHSHTHTLLPALNLACKEVVLYCLENRVCDVNHRDYAGYCALHEACARGWLTIVQHLLDYGADINCSAQDGTRPIHDAVENDHLDVVRILLSYGADPTLATYSGRGLLKMTHSETMEHFLTDYFADLQGRSDDDPGLYWEFYGSSVCESSEEGGIYDVLADPPGPFEFEFSDRPLLPCYNIQVSLSQGPRNWLLLSDVLRRLRMSARSFRQAFPHMEVVTVAEAEFYRQASLSQLFSCPEELEGFHPDSKDLLDLVEDSTELATLLGSTLECLDDHWDHPADALKDRIK